MLENLRTAAMFGAPACATGAMPTAAAMAVLDEVGMTALAISAAGTLTLSGQKRLELARAIATGARLVLIDEVMAGLTPTEVARCWRPCAALRNARRPHPDRDRARDAGADAALPRIIVLHHGERIAQGAPEAIANDPQVLRVYLGEAA